MSFEARNGQCVVSNSKNCLAAKKRLLSAKILVRLPCAGTIAITGELIHRYP